MLAAASLMPMVSAPAPNVSAMRDANPKPEEAPITSTRLGPAKVPAAIYIVGILIAGLAAASGIKYTRQAGGRRGDSSLRSE